MALAQPRNPARLPRAFYARNALVVARALVGTHLVVARGNSVHVARIVETEAYCGPTDLACHARAGVTRRTKTLYGPPGRAYVFLIYGMYDCFNVVCFGEGKGHAVLVRAVEPVTPLAHRTDGPGRLTRALGITRADDTTDLVEGGSVWLEPGTAARARIATTPRIGVGYAGAWADEPWRFFDAKSAFVSKPAARMIGRGGKT